MMQPNLRRRSQNRALRSRNLVTSQGRTSIRLEDSLWTAFDEICRQVGMNKREFSLLVDHNRPDGVSFTSAIRIFVVDYLRGHPARSDDAGAAMDAGLAGLARIDGVRIGDEVAVQEQGRPAPLSEGRHIPKQPTVCRR